MASDQTQVWINCEFDKEYRYPWAHVISCKHVQGHVWWYKPCDPQACVQDIIRINGGIDKLVHLLDAGHECEATHRALLAIRVLTEREVDRLAILRANGIPKLVDLIRAGPKCEVTEYAAAALGNLAAGGQILKNAIREVLALQPARIEPGAERACRSCVLVAACATTGCCMCTCSVLIVVQNCPA